MSALPSEKGSQLDEKIESISDDEMKNAQAFKGDDSDGKVHWTFRNAVAAVSLGGLYAGGYSQHT